MPFHSVLRAAPTQPDLATGDAKQEGWVTVFGFPEGYQDGVMRHLRDRGEVVESQYSGTNYMSVKFKSVDTVAEVLSLHGTILPADGMPGDNYMIGVKRGCTLPRKPALDTAASQYGGGLAAGLQQQAQQGGKGSVDNKGLSVGFGRFLSELLSISDLGAR